MRAISSPTFVPMAALAGVLFFAAPAGANDVDPLDAFGGSAWPDYYVDSQLAEVPATAPVKERYLLLAQTDQADIDDVNDPLEPMNRVFFAFNEFVYTAFLDPIAKSYNYVVPAPARTALGNVLDYLASPITLANDLLQLEFDRAMTTIARFAVNTIGGFGGFVDLADGIGLKKHKEDFGQTLGSYGLGEGFYLVLPLLGPSNPRDAVGKYLVDPFFDPLGMYLVNTDSDTARYARIGVTALDEYAGIIEELAQIKKTSVDYYAAIRSLYRQRRAADIANGADGGLPEIPNYEINFGPDTSGSIAGAK
jgi:phospholipid-binding lipoprotein MlaA